MTIKRTISGVFGVLIKGKKASFASPYKKGKKLNLLNTIKGDFSDFPDTIKRENFCSFCSPYKRGFSGLFGLYIKRDSLLLLDTPERYPRKDRNKPFLRLYKS